jgi:hypothetical protein
MSMCGMEIAHKFLAYKNAMNTTYKLENHITAAHFARQVLELEPTGVSTSSFMIILDFCIQARCDPDIQEVLSELPKQRQE